MTGENIGTSEGNIKTFVDLIEDEQHDESPATGPDEVHPDETNGQTVGSEDDPLTTSNPDGGNGPPVNTESGDDDRSRCPCYTDELARARNELDQEVFSKLNLTEVKCGHAIDYFRRFTGTSLTVKTARGYACNLRRYIEYLHDDTTGGGKTVCEAEFNDVEEFIESLVRLKRSEQTLKIYRTAITNLHKHISIRRDAEANVKWDVIREEINPGEYNVPERREREPLERHEVKKLYDAIDSRRDRLVVQMGVELGPRNREIRTLTTDDVDLEAKEVEFNNVKGGGSHTMPLSEPLTLLLRRWIEQERAAHPGSDGNDVLFPHREGGELDQTGLTLIVKKAAERAGVQEWEQSEAPLTEREKELLRTDKDYKEYAKVTPHTLRHTFCALLKDAGAPQKVRSQALNHNSTEVTEMFYEHDKGKYKEILNELFPDLTVG